ncbi:hypothetical protein ABPG77_008873 [Micractinium sp. CCAP 211/92]
MMRPTTATSTAAVDGAERAYNDTAPIPASQDKLKQSCTEQRDELLQKADSLIQMRAHTASGSVAAASNTATDAEGVWLGQSGSGAGCSANGERIVPPHLVWQAESPLPQQEQQPGEGGSAGSDALAAELQALEAVAERQGRMREQLLLQLREGRQPVQPLGAAPAASGGHPGEGGGLEAAQLQPLPQQEQQPGGGGSAASDAPAAKLQAMLAVAERHDRMLEQLLSPEGRQPAQQAGAAGNV